MSHSDEEDDQEEVEAFEHEMYDASDVKFEVRNRGRNQIVLIAKSETDFNLLKYYLALKDYVDKIETELNIMAQAEGEH